MERDARGRENGRSAGIESEKIYAMRSYIGGRHIPVGMAAAATTGDRL